jgi:hypothetical protein
MMEEGLVSLQSFMQFNLIAGHLHEENQRKRGYLLVQIAFLQRPNQFAQFVNSILKLLGYCYFLTTKLTGYEWEKKEIFTIVT